MSNRELELRKIEVAEMERKQQGLLEGLGISQRPVASDQNGNNTTTVTSEQRQQQQQQQQQRQQDESTKKDQTGARGTPVLRLVNQQIVVDSSSLQVDRHAEAEKDAGELEDVVESSFTRKINQASYGKRSKTESWDDELTDLFYRGLRMFGTDFSIISKMFPGRSRHQIKLKFNNEERRHPERIKETLLGPSEVIDIATYSEMTNEVYDDPKDVFQQIENDKKEIEEKHVREKEAQENLMRNPSGGSNGAANNKESESSNKAPAKEQHAVSEGHSEEILGSIDDLPAL